MSETWQTTLYWYALTLTVALALKMVLWSYGKLKEMRRDDERDRQRDQEFDSWWDEIHGDGLKK